MREIKFRGKRVENGEWVYGQLVYKKCLRDNGMPEIYFKMWEEEYVYIYEDNSENNIEEYPTEFVEIIPETIGQFTGLYDKNNTPIYEGDLIKYACGGTEDYVIQEIDEVFFNNEYGTFEIAINKNKENSEVLGFWLADLYEDSFYQVIGNIFDKED